jgi:hypothetical protein
MDPGSARRLPLVRDDGVGVRKKVWLRQSFFWANNPMYRKQVVDFAG